LLLQVAAYTLKSIITCLPQKYTAPACTIDSSSLQDNKQSKKPYNQSRACPTYMRKQITAIATHAGSLQNISMRSWHQTHHNVSPNTPHATSVVICGQ
jgi:hypothetical protein